jgi:DNA-binding GntR family transcriptional regulator
MTAQALDDAPRLAPLAGGSPFVPLRVAVCERLREAILDGTFPPGAVLSENRIAGELEVSRTPVREALRALEQERLLEWRPGRRLGVPVPTARDIDEIYGIRILVETEALRRVRSDDAALIARLRDCVRRGEQAALAGHGGEMAGPGADFHATLLSALGNRRLEQFVDSIQELAHRFRRLTLRDEDWAREGAAQHARILALVEVGRSEDAVAVLCEHLTGAAQVLRRRLAQMAPGNGHHEQGSRPAHHA